VPKIRILLADDHPIVRSGLRALVDTQRDMEVVGEAADGAEAVEQAERLRPDVLLLDLSMPRLGGLAAIRFVAAKAPGTKVLVLTMHDEPAYLRQALAAGSAGYLAKMAVDIELVAAIRAVCRGETYVHSSLTSALVPSSGSRPPAAGDRLEILSAREQEVLHLLARGYTNQQAADSLAVSVKTIETHRARLFDKLGLRTRAELVQYALDRGLLHPDGSPR
jgi:two-component system, NarL family, response regulator NreC